MVSFSYRLRMALADPRKRLVLVAAAALLGLPFVRMALSKRQPEAPAVKGTLGVGNEAAQRLWGPLEFVPYPQPSNPEAILITNGWSKDNIVDVPLPGLGRVVSFHRKGADRLVALFQAWADAGLIDRILSFDGTWVPRFVRGSKTNLSNHAFGVAFDINARWNPMGKPPASPGEIGSVWELASIAKQLGWTWGGDYTGRQDGMHFELKS